MPLMTKAEYARHRGCSKPFISKSLDKLATAIVLDEKGRERIDSEKADAIFAANRDPSRSLPGATGQRRGKPADDETGDDVLPGDEGFTATKTKRERVKLEHEQINLAERKSQLVPRDGVVAAGAKAGQMIREQLRETNRDLAEKLATMNDTRAILVALEERDRRILGTVSDDFMRRIQGAGNEHPTVN
jgi:hypothetical protein